MRAPRPLRAALHRSDPFYPEREKWWLRLAALKGMTLAEAKRLERERWESWLNAHPAGTPDDYAAWTRQWFTQEFESRGGYK